MTNEVINLNYIVLIGDNKPENVKIWQDSEGNNKIFKDKDKAIRGADSEFRDRGISWLIICW